MTNSVCTAYTEGGLPTAARWMTFGYLAWLSAMLSACGASDGLPSRSDSIGSDSAKVRPSLFTDVTAEAGLGGFRNETGAAGDKWFPETMGSGGGFADVNGDGKLDVVLVAGGVWSGTGPPALRLYVNDGDGTFSDRTSEYALATISAYGMGVTAADYDGDGDEDLFVTALRRDLLLRNDGGQFVDVSEEAGLDEDTSWSTASVFFDPDRDGDLDLYVGKYARWSADVNVKCSLDGVDVEYCTPEVYEDVAGHFYINQGDGTFIDDTENAGFVSHPGKNLGAVAFDYNRDGWSDLIVANDQKRNLLYTNRGDGTFDENGLLAGIAFNDEGKARAGMGIDVGVVDTTGRPTVFIGNFSQERMGVFRFAGNGLFDTRDVASGLGNATFMTLTFGLFLFDVNLDGALDVFAANGHLQESISDYQDGVSYRQRPQLFLGTGDGRFVEHEPPPDSPLAKQYVARGAATGDYDGDGDLDILLTENGGPVHLWRNDQIPANADTSHYLHVKLSGTEKNTAAIGARVIVCVHGKSQEQTVKTGASYLSNMDYTLTFGLGPTSRIDSLFVHWPSGTTERYADIEANQVVEIDQATGRLLTVSRAGSPPE